MPASVAVAAAAATGEGTGERPRSLGGRFGAWSVLPPSRSVHCSLIGASAIRWSREDWVRPRAGKFQVHLQLANERTNKQQTLG